MMIGLLITILVCGGWAIVHPLYVSMRYAFDAEQEDIDPVTIMTVGVLVAFIAAACGFT